MSIKSAAVYCRISTDGQRTDSQLAECRDWCQRNEEIPVVEYVDKASGSTVSRKALDRMLADMKAGKLKCVVCYKLDRLGRSLTHLVQMIAEFEKYKVAFICPSQGIDTRESNPGGRLQMHMLMAIAEFERSLIRERTKAGLAAAKARGVVLGKPKGRKIVLPLEAWSIAEQQGVSLREFSRANNVSESTMRWALKEGQPA